MAASSLVLLKQDTGDLWDSNKVLSDNTTDVVYNGKQLASGGECYGKSAYGIRTATHHMLRMPAFRYFDPAMLADGSIRIGEVRNFSIENITFNHW